jgi:hypothetical protein
MAATDQEATMNLARAVQDATHSEFSTYLSKVAGLILIPSLPRPPERRPRSRCHSAACSRVICATSSLPFVSGLNSRVMTNMIAAPVVATNIGTAKPSG